MRSDGRRPVPFRRRARRALVIVHRHRPELERRLPPLRALLTRRGVRHEIVVADGDDLAARVRALAPDLVISLGGDGTALAAGRAVAGRGIPVLPVNLGGLGFLASAERDRLVPAVAEALDGRWRTEERRLVAAAVVRRGRRRRAGAALNDAVLRDGIGHRALRVDLALDGQPLGHLLADGLVVATAIGSTAYSLSAGGPLVLDDVDVLLAVPVCPHTLSGRALVFAGSRRLTARVAARDSQVVLALDGQKGLPLTFGDEVEFTRARQTVLFLRPPGGGHTVGALRAKLGWQGTPLRRSP